MSLPPSCRCGATECGNSLIGGTCDPPGWCLDVRAPCVPTQWGRGVPYPLGTHPPPTVDSLGGNAGTPAADLGVTALLGVAALASYTHAAAAPLLMLLGAAGVAALVVSRGFARVPWWLWVAAATAVVMYALGMDGVQAFSNVALLNSIF